MYAITGITDKIGGELARNLLAAGQRVRAIVRNKSKGKEWAAVTAAFYKSLKNDLPSFHADPSWTLPMSACYVIRTDGVIAYGGVNPDYTRRPDPPELLPVLDRRTARQAA